MSVANASEPSGGFLTKETARSATAWRGMSDITMIRAHNSSPTAAKPHSAPNRRRSEVIVCLVPRIVPICGPVAARELLQVDRATSPIVTPDLRRARRDFEPLLPDATRNPRRLELKRVPCIIPNLDDPVPYPPEYYFPRAFGPAYETSLPLDDH